MLFQLQPEDYGYDVPSSFWKLFGKKGENGEPEEIYWKDIVDVTSGTEERIRHEPNANERRPGKELKERILADPFRWRQNVLAAKKDQEERMTKQNSRDKMPKWKKNQTLKKWWEGKYGEQNYFSIQDAIKESFIKFYEIPKETEMLRRRATFILKFLEFFS